MGGVRRIRLQEKRRHHEGGDQQCPRWQTRVHSAQLHCTCFGLQVGRSGRYEDRRVLGEAKPIEVKFDCCPCEFATGSFGWMASRKQEVKMGDKVLMLQVDMNCILDKSKDANKKETDTVIDEIDPQTALSKTHFDTIGVASGKKNDLTKIRGVGPWIEGRLNKIGICTFKQIASMTIDIEHDVEVAIKYFEGRVIRDEWTYQAQAMVKGDWEKLNPLFPRSGKGHYITIDGVEYERKLIDLADHAVKDGVIEFWEAQALWWSATDDQQVTATEKKTLEYIMKTKNLDDEAKTYLEQRIATI